MTELKLPKMQELNLSEQIFKDKKILRNIAVKMQDKQFFENAIIFFELAVNAGHKKCLINIGVCYQELGDIEKSKSNIEKANMYFSKSVLYFEKALIECEDPSIADNLYFYYQNNNDFDNMYRILKIGANLNSSVCCYILGDYYNKIGKNVKALEILKQIKN